MSLLSQANPSAEVNGCQLLYEVLLPYSNTTPLAITQRNASDGSRCVDVEACTSACHTLCAQNHAAAAVGAASTRWRQLFCTCNHAGLAADLGPSRLERSEGACGSDVHSIRWSHVRGLQAEHVTLLVRWQLIRMMYHDIAGQPDLSSHDVRTIKVCACGKLRPSAGIENPCVPQFACQSFANIVARHCQRPDAVFLSTELDQVRACRLYVRAEP